MILDSSLPSFNISTEDETDKILFNGGEVGTGTYTPDRILTVNGTIHVKGVKVDINVLAT